MENCIRLIKNRLLYLGCDIENYDFNIIDYIDEISDIMNKYNLHIEELEDLLLYKNYYEYKRYSCDIDEGIHMEEIK